MLFFILSECIKCCCSQLCSSFTILFIVDFCASFFFRFGVTRLPPIAWSEFSCNLFYCWPSRELMHKTFKLIILLSQQHRLCARFIADWIRCGACRFSKKSLYCCCFRISLSRLCFDHNSILIKNIFFMYFCSKLVFTHSLISLFLLFLVWKMSNKTWFIFCDVSRALALISVLHPKLRVCLSLNFKAQSPTAAESQYARSKLRLDWAIQGSPSRAEKRLTTTRGVNELCVRLIWQNWLATRLSSRLWLAREIELLIAKNIGSWFHLVDQTNFSQFIANFHFQGRFAGEPSRVVNLKVSALLPLLCDSTVQIA